jgi:hypothetical protein
MHLAPTLRTWLCAAAAVCSALPALAADKPAKPSTKPATAASAAGGIANLGKGAANNNEQPILTRDQLRACLALQERLRTEETQMAQEQRDLDAEKASVMQQGEALKGELAALDRTSASGVEAYNAKTVEQERRIDAYNARSKPFNTKVEALQSQRDGFERDCGNRRYREDDLILIKSGH